MKALTVTTAPNDDDEEEEDEMEKALPTSCLKADPENSPAGGA